MYKKILIIAFLNIGIIFLLILINLQTKKQYYLKKEIRRYDLLIYELKKIKKINQRISKIKTYSKNEAKNIILSFIDSSLKNNLLIQKFELKNPIISELEFNNKIDIKNKKFIKSLFQQKYPFVIFKQFNLNKNNLQLNITIKAPYKGNNGK